MSYLTTSERKLSTRYRPISYCEKYGVWDVPRLKSDIYDQYSPLANGISPVARSPQTLHGRTNSWHKKHENSVPLTYRTELCSYRYEPCITRESMGRYYPRPNKHYYPRIWSY